MIEVIKNIFQLGFYQPLFNALLFIYHFLPWESFGLTIILFTFLVKLALYPLGAKAIRSQKALSNLSPKIKEIQEKHKDDKEKQTKAIMDFYKKENINPFSGCFPVLLQLPVLIALFRIFQSGFDSDKMRFLYSFTPHPGEISTVFLGLIDLSQPNLLLAVLAGVSLFFQTKISAPKIKSKNSGEFQAVLQKQMQYFLPFFTIMILLNLPSALGLYWLTTTIFGIGQHYIVKTNTKN